MALCRGKRAFSYSHRPFGYPKFGFCKCVGASVEIHARLYLLPVLSIFRGSLAPPIVLCCFVLLLLLFCVAGSTNASRWPSPSPFLPLKIYHVGYMKMPYGLYGRGLSTIRRSRVGFITRPFVYLKMARRLYDAAQSSIWRCRVGSTTRPFDYSKMPICLHGHGCLTMWRSRVGSTTRLFDYLEKPCWLYNTAVRLFGDGASAL